MAQSWFGRPAVVTDGVVEPDSVGAYRAGRRDERHLAEQAEEVAHADQIQLDKAYQRGLTDGKRARRGSIIGGLLTVVLVVFAVLAVLLVVREGSFTQAGEVVDNALSTTVTQAQTPVRDAADKTGDALQKAGADLKQKAGTPAR